MADKLLPCPCPYCGTKAVEYDKDWKIEHKNTCFLYREFQTTWLVSDREIERWNHRPQRKPVDAKTLQKVIYDEHEKSCLGCECAIEFDSLAEAILSVADVYEKEKK